MFCDWLKILWETLLSVNSTGHFSDLILRTQNSSFFTSQMFMFKFMFMYPLQMGKM